jgi:hypothetical protein
MNHTCECGNNYPATPFKLSEECTIVVGNCPLCGSANLSLSGHPAFSMLQAVTLAELFTNAAFELAGVLGIRDPFMLDEEELLKAVTQ